MSKRQAAILIATLAGAMALLRNDAPRGIRNNNPLNIRNNPSNKWRGMIGADDKNFVVFDDPVYGFRAATKILESYANRNIITLKDIINTWSPVNGVDDNGEQYTNNTSNYLRSVSDKTGIQINEVVDRENYLSLLKAMTYFENGVNPYNTSTIAKGIDLAYG